MSRSGYINLLCRACQVDIGLLAFPRADGGESAGLGSEMRSNIRFLEDIVRRLSEELSKVQASDTPSTDGRSLAGATPPAFLEVKAIGTMSVGRRAQW
jgi:hypothetical protein